MKRASIYKDLVYKENGPAINILYETDFTKEIRILLATDQVMKKHQTSFPITVEVVEGELDFGVNKESINMIKGDLISLPEGIPHDLKAKTNCIIRLTAIKVN